MSLFKHFVAFTLWAPSLVIARECTVSPDDDPILVSSADAALGLFADCSTIVANGILIGDDYNGTFSLAGVKNITGTLGRNGHSGLERIEMPDLQYLGGLWLVNTNVDYVYFENLLAITDALHVQNAAHGIDMVFPNLTTVDAVTIGPSYSSLELPSLETVSSTIAIDACTACNAPKEEPPAILNLPALSSVGFINVSGRLDRVDLPALTSAGWPAQSIDYPYDSGVRIRGMAVSLELAFPNLIAVDYQFNISGTIRGLDIPSLEHTDARIIINSSIPLDLDLPLRDAATIELAGQIAHANMPNLNLSATPLTIASTIPCTALGAGLEDSAYYRETCGDPTRYEQHLSAGGKAAAGVVVPLGIMGILLAIVLWYKKRVRWGQKARGEVVGDVEMVDLPSTSEDARGVGYGGGEDSGEVERGRIPVTQPGRMERERSPTPPPPYQPREGS